jgi:hypothetical protein
VLKAILVVEADLLLGQRAGPRDLLLPNSGPIDREAILATSST